MTQAKCYECADRPSLICDRCKALMCQNHYKPTNDLNPDDQQYTTICLACYESWIKYVKVKFVEYLLDFRQDPPPAKADWQDRLPDAGVAITDGGGPARFKDS